MLLDSESWLADIEDVHQCRNISPLQDPRQMLKETVVGKYGRIIYLVNSSQTFHGQYFWVMKYKKSMLIDVHVNKNIGTKILNQS